MPAKVPPAELSDGKLTKFMEGWALPSEGFVAHYYRRSGVGFAVSICGKRRDLAGRLFGAGSMRICPHCAAANQTITEMKI